MNFFNFIFWDFGPELFTLGSFSLRWYSLGFLFAFLIGQQILFKIYRIEGRSVKEVDAITIYMIVGTILGARLGHCFFYDPDYYLANPLKILKVWEGGLASHGAAVGILLSIYLFQRKYKINYIWLFDRIVICVALAAMFIRLGNLMNSEIVGTISNNPTAMVYINQATSSLEKYVDFSSHVEYEYNEKDTTVNGFNYPGLTITVFMNEDNNTAVEANSAGNAVAHYITNNENTNYKNLTSFNETASFDIDDNSGIWVAKVKTFGVPRHPAQTYEAFSSLILFLILGFIYNKMRKETPHGRLFGIFLIYLFGLRFFYEFLKENQSELIDTAKEASTLNMGQLLSIPLVLIGIFILVLSYKRKRIGPNG